MYYRNYRSAVRSGRSSEDAIRHAVDEGLVLERTVFGLTSTGVLSVADLGVGGFLEQAAARDRGRVFQQPRGA